MNQPLSIPIDLLHDHPDNANRVSSVFMKKLQCHIAESGEYPPLIVRPHPRLDNAYEIIDGHHRRKVLARLGYEQVRCEVWEVDDEHTALLLLTLNRLHGDDDPRIRATLLSKLRESMDITTMAQRLPDDVKRIRRLLELTKPPPAPAFTDQAVSMMNLSDTPRAITFFLSVDHHRTLLRRLRRVKPDRNAALVMILKLEADDE